MSPTIRENTFFIASGIPYVFHPLKKGDIILFKNNNINIVKKIAKIDRYRIFVEGENKSDSKNFPPIHKNEIIGRVIWIF